MSTVTCQKFIIHIATNPDKEFMIFLVDLWFGYLSGSIRTKTYRNDCVCVCQELKHGAACGQCPLAFVTPEELENHQANTAIMLKLVFS